MAYRQARQTGITYLVQDGFWYSLPLEMRTAVYTGFHQAYTFSTGRSKAAAPHMKLVGVDQTRVPKQIDFVDAVVQVVSNQVVAQKSLNEAVVGQFRQVQQYIVRPLPSWINNPKVDIGMAFCLKEVLKPRSPKTAAPICVTESIISLDNAINAWQLKLYMAKEKHVTKGVGTAWLKRASKEELKWFGVCLGRVVAHEAWHQIWSGDKTINTTEATDWGKPHPNKSYHGIEEDQCGKSWHKKVLDPAFAGAGRTWIAETLTKLDKLQGRLFAHPIIRR